MYQFTSYAMRSDATALPKYVQLSEMLIREIAAGRLVDGERLPPERAMAAELGVAVGTLRKALGDLEHKGLLERIQGSGNYVRHRSDIVSIYAFFRLELIGGGGLPTARVLSLDTLPKPAELPTLGQSETAHRIRRLRFLSGKPVALEEIWLDGGWATVLDQADLSESLYLTYRTLLGLWIAQAEDHVGVGKCPDWMDQVEWRIEGTCGLVERWGRTAEGETAEYSRTWFDSDMCRYVSRMR